MNIITGSTALQHHLGRELGTSGWRVLPQSTITAFADVTDDHQWIHVDEQRAASGPYGTTIAHGYLLLSLLPTLTADTYRIEGVHTRINYGLDRVRFPAPVPAGSRIRLRSSLTELNETATGMRCVVHNVIERDNTDRPACVADTVTLLTFTDPTPRSPER